MKNIDFIYGEDWKSIARYDYLVSNYGRVYSLKRKKILTPFITPPTKYLTVKLGGGCRFSNYKVHRLVAAAFVKNPDGKPIVHHIDGNSLNNSADNLMWVTAKEHKNIHRKLRQKARESNG